MFSVDLVMTWTSAKNTRTSVVCASVYVLTNRVVIRASVLKDIVSLPTNERVKVYLIYYSSLCYCK